MRLDEKFFRYFVYLPAATVRGQGVVGPLRFLEASQWLPGSEIQRLQLQRLNRLIAWARNRSREYSRRLCGLPERLESIDQLARAPLLDKQQLRNSADALRCAERTWFTKRKTTGGSTGEPVTVDKNAKAVAWELAAAWRGYRWAGLDIGQRQARFWGLPITARKRFEALASDLICRRRRFSAFDFSVTRLAEYERELRAYQADSFYGYASMLAEFARWYLEKKPGEAPLRPRAVVSTSEVLTAEDRAVIGKAFGAPGVSTVTVHIADGVDHHQGRNEGHAEEHDERDLVDVRAHADLDIARDARPLPAIGDPVEVAVADAVLHVAPETRASARTRSPSGRWRANRLYVGARG